MGRQKRPRKPRGRPNYLDLFILKQLNDKGRVEVRGFPKRGTFFVNSERLELNFTRQAVYAGFKRLEKKGLLERVEKCPLTYRLKDSNSVMIAINDLLSKINPLLAASKADLRKPKLKEVLKKCGQNYEGLRESRKDFSADIKEVDFKSLKAISTTEMLTGDEAKTLNSRIRSLLNEEHFVRKEKQLKSVPFLERTYRKGGYAPQKIPLLLKENGTRKFSSPSLSSTLIPNPICSQCLELTIQVPEGHFVCPKCGLECSFAKNKIYRT